MAVKYTGGFKVLTFKQLNVNSVPPEHFFFWNTSPGEIYSGNEETAISTSVSATDTESLPINYSLANATTMPSGVVLQSDGSIIGTLPAVNEPTDYVFDVMATNGQTNIFRTFSITVENVAQNPVWSTPAGIIYYGNENSAVTANVVATVSSGLPITYALTNASTLPGGVSLSNSGAITGILPTVNTNTTYNFDVRASTTEGFADRNFGIVANNVAVTPVWSTPSGQIYSGNENTAITANVVATVSNGLPITYSLTNATTLPGGVTLSNAGLITGTLPSVSNTTSYNFTVRAATSEANADRDFSIQSVLVPVIPVWSTPAGSFYSDNENVAFSKNMVATVSDASSITYALVNATTLPSGVSMLSNGLVYGTLPDVANNTTYNFDVRATATEGSADRSFSITSVNVITDPNYNTIWVMSHFDNAVTNSATYFDHGPSHTALNGDFTNGPMLSNTASKFGGSSLYYATNNSTFSIPYDAGTDFANGAFTVEMWFNYTSGQTVSRSLWNRGRDSALHTTHVMNMTTNASSRLQFYWGVSSMTGTTVIQAGTWYHVAITRNGGNVAMYLNGVQETTGSGFSITGGQGIYPIFIGGNSGTARFQGYMDDLRISKMVRYTGTFTPPAAPFPNS